MPRQAWKLVAVALAWSSFGCAAQRLILSEAAPPSVGHVVPDLTHVRIAVCEFLITNRSSKDSQHRANVIEGAFLRQLAESGVYGAIGPCDVQDSELVRVAVRVYLKPDHSASRTYFLDAPFFFYPFGGYWPLTPQWGRAEVFGRVQVEGAPEAVLPIEVATSAPYSMLFYSWYRTAPIEEAYGRAWQGALRALAERLTRRIAQAIPVPAGAPALAVLPDRPPVLLRGFEVRTSTGGALIAEVETSTGGALIAEVETSTAGAPIAEAETASVSPSHSGPLPAPVPSVEEMALAMAAQQLAEPGEIRLPESGFRIIVEPLRQEARPWWWERLLRPLGGLEGSVTGGRASVSSRTANQFGVKETVGTGDARSSGYRVSLYRPPVRTGFFFPPRFGFFSQDIEISGFRDEIPLHGLTGSDTIPARVTDPMASGEPVNIDEPIAYFLRLKSGYLGQGIGFNLVAGTEDVQFFGTTQVSVNLLEVRHSDVTVHETRVKGTSMAFFESGQLTAQAGFAVPAWHLAVRTAVEYEWFRSFDYPEPVEFQAATSYNPDKQVFERERLFVEGASLYTLNWQVSAVVLF